MKICKKGLHQYEGRHCKECFNVRAKAYRLANADKLNNIAKEWAKLNPNKLYESKQSYYKKNSDKIKSNVSAYRKANRDKRNSLNAKHRADKVKATPKWLTEEHLKQINSFYKKAKQLEKLYNIEYQVDHIIPLRGKNVSGLHVPWNLRVITKENNLKKGNKLVEYTDED
jgi:5-methylcytosine-specific restriction endonuclease McrA